MIRNGKTLWRRKDGIAATEFALIMPVLIILILGVVELGNALLLDRKVTSATQIAADLIAQSRTVSTTDVNDVFNALDMVLQPFPSNSATYTISSVIMDSQNRIVVDWSDSRGGTAASPGSGKAIPMGLVSAGDSVIVAEISYQFTPIFGSALIDGFTISDSAYLKPRQTPVIPRTN